MILDRRSPFALLAEIAHGPRLAATNAAGREAGVRPGTMLADALRCAFLDGDALHPAANRSAAAAAAARMVLRMGITLSFAWVSETGGRRRGLGLGR